MVIIKVKGFSKTGKTATVTSLISELKKRGYTVGSVKDIHFAGYEPDAPGTDTYKHAQAGARRVTAIGPNSTAIMSSKKMDIDTILKYYKEDFVIIEGDCGIECPTIITGKTAEDIDKRMCPEAFAISGIISNDMKEYKGLPVINGITEVEKMADMVEKKKKMDDEGLDVELTIDGEDIYMVPFVKATVKNVVVGVVKALNGYEEGKEIVIKVK